MGLSTMLLFVFVVSPMVDRGGAPVLRRRRENRTNKGILLERETGLDAPAAFPGGHRLIQSALSQTCSVTNSWL